MIKNILPAAFILATNSIAWAENPAPIPKQNVIDVLNIDLNDDGRSDRVIMFETGEGRAAVEFYIRETENNTLVYSTTLDEPIWSGVMYGTIPSLDQNDAGSVLVKSQNIAIGRNRWEQVITVAYRNGALRIIGFTYSWHDTLSLNDSGKCDINYLSQKASLKLANNVEEWFEVEESAQPVESWTTYPIENICFTN